MQAGPRSRGARLAKKSQTKGVDVIDCADEASPTWLAPIWARKSNTATRCRCRNTQAPCRHQDQAVGTDNPWRSGRADSCAASRADLIAVGREILNNPKLAEDAALKARSRTPFRKRAAAIRATGSVPAPSAVLARSHRTLAERAEREQGLLETTERAFTCSPRVADFRAPFYERSVAGPILSFLKVEM